MDGKRKERRGEGKEAKKGWSSEGDRKGKGKLRQAEDVKKGRRRIEKGMKRTEKEGKIEERGEGKE